MKRIKCYLSILLVISMMLCSTSMFTVNAAQVTETDEIIVDTEVNLDSEDELQPMMANGCGNLTSWYDIDHETKGYILADVTGNWKNTVGNNPNIYYDGNGFIVLCGTGSYAGKSYVTDLERNWYL